MAKTSKKIGDPFEKGDPVWVMNLNGKNRAGFFGRITPAGTFVSAGKAGKSGWWIDANLNEIRHRFQGDGVLGENPGPDSPEKNTDDVDPLAR